MINSNLEIFIFNNNKRYNVTKILEKVKWSGDYKSAARKLEFSLAYRYLPIRFGCGDLVAFYVGGQKIFDGYIWDDSLDSSSNNLDLLAYDKGIYLLKNQLAYNFKSTKAESIASKVANELGISVGSIVATNVDVTKVFLGVSAYDIIMTAYTIASEKTGKKYMCYIEDNKLYVDEKGKVKLNIGFEEGKNLINSTIKNSLESMVNKVVIVDDNGNKKEEVKNDEWIKLYGMIQNVIQSKEDTDSKEEAKKTLKGVETTCSLHGYGDISCITGYGVQVKDTYTNMAGLFYINTDNHTWENGDYKIELEISLENIMNEVSAGQDENESSSSSGGTTVKGGKEYPAEFTAYYPSNDPMQGGYKSANGETLKPSSLTCACPTEVPYNTKIQVKGTGSSRDGIVYRCNDRGGAIKIVNGVYKIDLLMSNRKEAYDFGRRKGKVLIGVDVVNSGSDGTSSSKAKKAVEVAASKVGGQYVWGSTGPKTFDCSGLTQYAYKQAGITIPRTSKDQSNFGKSISKDNLQTGDLLFFCTNESGSVSHVGIYEGNGVMIHASSPKNGIKRDKLTSSYYFKNGIWKGARRVV